MVYLKRYSRLRGYENMRVADFFCGGGGFSEGFRQAGFEIVFAVDKWAPAVNTYRGNKPGVNVIQDDVIRISKLPDDEFEALVPDSEVIIGSPPCQSFSHSNKSGGADKSIGIQLIEAYLRIIARKKYKKGSVLKYWVLENVPAVEEYIKKEYSAADLGLKGDFVLRPHDGASGKYNAKFFGAPTNRERYLCGEFPMPVATKGDNDVTTLQMVLDSLGSPLSRRHDIITDINYPGLALERQQVTDHRYIYELADFECKTAKRLKQDKGYMGKMSFPEDTTKPARTVMATMSSSSRESMILGYKRNKKKRYRLPTVREAACMMSFPIDYWFYGQSKATKHTLVGNAVPPKMSYAIAKAIAEAEDEPIPEHYPRIVHDETIDFMNLNGVVFEIKQERQRRDIAKFKYHIPYLIIDAYRVELTNYHSDFKNREFKWDVEIHYSQGKDKAKVFTPTIAMDAIPVRYRRTVTDYLENIYNMLTGMNEFQAAYCMTTQQREMQHRLGPYELLDDIRAFIDRTLKPKKRDELLPISEEPQQLPMAILIGYYILSSITHHMGGLQ